MEITLGMHAYYFHDEHIFINNLGLFLQNYFFTPQLANGSTHGDETVRMTITSFP